MSYYVHVISLLTVNNGGGEPAQLPQEEGEAVQLPEVGSPEVLPEEPVKTPLPAKRK